MGRAFFILDTKAELEDRTDKIIPDAVVMDTNYPIIDGKLVEVPATSGISQYMIVTPDDYPKNQTERDARGIAKEK
jgi:hypothetical protein